MNNEILVKVDQVSKIFCRDLKKSLWYGVKDVASELLPFNKAQGIKHMALAAGDPGLRPGEFWANKDISFELRRGECIGLIGRNGAGKTTLLKMLNGLIKPDTGTIEMRGRVGALIALGAGFNPILTGRENIYVNGSILGLTKQEIDNKIEDIIDFAEIREFIDSPVQSYSSGMQVRLGFAVATAMEPDILILDEVLAVGDLAFRMKCYNRIDNVKKNAAVIFVSHNMEHISRICSSTLVLNHGRQIHFGDVVQGLMQYESDNHSEQVADSEFKTTKIGRVDIQIVESETYTGGSKGVDLIIEATENITINTRLTIIDSNNGTVAGTAETKIVYPDGINLKQGTSHYRMALDSLHLRPGNYELAFSLFEYGTNELIYGKRGGMNFHISGSYYSECFHLMPLQVGKL